MTKVLKIGLALIIMAEVGLLMLFLAGSNSVPVTKLSNFVEQSIKRDAEIEQIIKEEPDAEIYIPEQYKKFVLSLCLKNNVPVDVFSKLIQSESRWKRKAINYNYAYVNKEKVIVSTDHGIAMLNDKNYDEFSWRFNDNLPVDPYNVEMALTISCRYLAWLYDRTDSWYNVICAYKSGITKVKEERVPKYIQILSKAVIDPKISALDVEFFP